MNTYNSEPSSLHYRLYGIDILKVFLAFGVVFDHLHGAIDNSVFFYWANNITPTFMMISFFFIEPIITELNFEKIKARIIKLAWQMTMWGLIYGGVYRHPSFDRDITVRWS